MTKKKTYGLRALLNDIHLWLGLISGLIIFLVCLSGTILTFEKEIEGWFQKELVVKPKGNKQPLNKLVQLPALKEKGTLTAVTLPTNAKQPYVFSIKEDPKQHRGTQYEVNPYTGEILKPEKSSAEGFMRFMFRLHRWLLLDTSIGRPIVGVATIVFLILSLTGIVLWFPKKIKWKYVKAGLKIKTDANWKRINHDLHNTLGFYACILIVIMGLTGLCWSFEGYRDGLSRVLGTPVFNRGGAPKISAGNTNGKQLTLEEAVALANKELSYAGELTISLPNKKNPFYNFRKLADASFSTVAHDQLTLTTTGTIINKEIYADKPLNVKIAGAIKSLHTGTIYGTFSKILYFFACLVGTSLPITGTFIYINKLKKKRKRNRVPKEAMA